MRLAGRSRGPALLAATLAMVGAAAARGPRLEGALSSEQFRVDRVHDHAFVDLDGDGVKEIMVRAEGAPLAPLEAVHRVDTGLARIDADGHRVLATTGEVAGPFAGVFRFDRTSFRWSPLLLACPGSDAVEVARFLDARVGESRLLHLTLRRDERVEDHLYRFSVHGIEEVLRVERGQRVGEGVWIQAGKVLVARGLADPFGPPGRTPGMLARVRYRWSGNRLQPEHWSLVGVAFRADLPMPSVPTWDGQQVHHLGAARRAWDLQRAADRGTGTDRVDLDEFCAARYPEGGCSIPYQREGFAVLLETVTGAPRPRYMVQPFGNAPGVEAPVWVGLDELAAPRGPAGAGSARTRGE